MHPDFSISAQWLRDTANQFAHYHSLLSVDKQLATLVKAVINNEARYVSQFPYCGAFQPPPESGLPTSHNDWADGVTVNPYVNLDNDYSYSIRLTYTDRSTTKSFLSARCGVAFSILHKYI